MMITDTEAMLLHMGNRDRAHAVREITLANREIARLRAELAAAQAELRTEKAKRHAAEFAARRH